jgi:hypothetical protein
MERHSFEGLAEQAREREVAVGLAARKREGPGPAAFVRKPFDVAEVERLARLAP